MVTAHQKAAILVEALPYIKKFYGKIIVIKYGGHAMVNCELKRAVMTDVILMKLVGMHPVLVHGGGPEITQMLRRVGKQSTFVNGLRVTDRETMEIVEMVLVGKINKEIVALINSLGGQAIGLCGKDANLLRARKKMTEVDIGFVGEVVCVNPTLIMNVIRDGYIPVIAPIGLGPEGESYNINADHVAGHLAVALGADKLVILTDVEGITVEREGERSVLSTLRLSEVPALVGQKQIAGGMLPKVECCANAIRGGVRRAHILDGRVPHAILLEIFTDEGIGTMVVEG
ncbi:MAG: Acetylglutamate kinase [Clostridia bacterium 62_21]|nr:MAG: Acetylglutamate kinase [Clostridia bacterium 62_21]HAG07429.1 acetylglutamate kinase [Peptococcaceae bacterium]